MKDRKRALRLKQLHPKKARLKLSNHTNISGSMRALWFHHPIQTSLVNVKDHLPRKGATANEKILFFPLPTNFKEIKGEGWKPEGVADSLNGVRYSETDA